MAQRLQFSGPYVQANEAMLRERVNRRDDPRHVFYEAMLENNTYEAYEAVVGTKTVKVETWNPPGLVSDHADARAGSWLTSATKDSVWARVNRPQSMDHTAVSFFDGELQKIGLERQVRRLHSVPDFPFRVANSKRFRIGAGDDGQRLRFYASLAWC